MNSVELLKVGDIRKSETNPRRNTDSAKLDELAKSIKEKGVLEPILVRRVDGKPVLICGERRLEAAKRAGLGTIPAIARDVTDEEALELQLVENLQREDVNPIDESLGFQELVSRFEHTPADIASQIGKSTTYVQRRIRLLSLSKDIQGAVAVGRITFNHAQVILRLQDGKDRKDLFATILEERMSAASAAGTLEYRFGIDLSDAPFNKGACGKCPHNGTKQMKLFEADQVMKGRCFKPSCFHEKVESLFQAKVAAVKKAGGTILESIPKHATMLDSYEGYRDQLGKSYKAKCLKCEHHQYGILEDRYEDVKKSIHPFCLNPTCLKRLLPKETGVHSGVKKDRSEIRRDQAREKVRQAKRAFWIEKLIIGAKTSHVRNAQVLSMLLEHVPGDQAKISGIRMPEYGPPSIKRLYETGDKALEAAISRAISAQAEFLDDKDLEFLTSEMGFDISKGFVITEPYLQAKVKAELIKLAREIGLDKHWEKSSEKPGSLESLKKGELIDLFLNTGFKLEGKVPKEIGGKKR